MPPKGWHPTPEMRAKQSAAQRSRPGRRGFRHHSIETRAKISSSLIGEKNSFFGRHHTEKTKAVLAEASRGNKNCLGVHPSAETRQKQSIAHQKHIVSEETKKKISAAGKERFSNPLERAKISDAMKRHYTDSLELEKLRARAPRCAKSAETKAKISATKIGEKNPNWHGGISYEPYCPKWNENLRVRIREFFDHRCITCGKSAEENVRKLSCHHVSYNKEACCDDTPVKFAAMCTSCHSKTNRDRVRWERMINRIIDEIYGGRSYFTKDEWERINAK